MKKLMTMIAAVGMAFGLFAAEEGAFISGTAFEGTEGPSWNPTDGFLSSYWTGTGEGITDVIGGSHVLGTNQRPEYFADEDVNDDHVLKIKTTLGTPVSLGVQPNSGTQDAPVLFDGLVNLTVFDAGDDAVPAEDLASAKIACYLQTNEDESETNFVVRAKNEPTGGWVCAPNAAIEPGWHRLTIKAIAVTSTQMGFVIFVDGDNTSSSADAVSCTAAKIVDTTDFSFEAKKWNETGSLFLSKAAGTAISAVAFDGQGSVDDLAFTTKAPAFAAGVDGYYVSFDDEKIAIEIAGETYTDSPAEIEAAPGTINIKWTALDGSILSNTTGKDYNVVSGGTITIPETDLTKAAASFDDIGYATIADAVAAATSDGELKLYQDETEGNVLSFTTGAITLNLNECGVAAGGDGAFSVKAGNSTTVTITGNGKIEGVLKTSISSSKIAIEGGQYKIKPNVDGTKITVPAGKYLAKVGDYYELDDQIDASTAVLDPASSEAEWFEGIKFPTVVVKINSEAIDAADVSVAWDPQEITEQKTGSQNYIGTVTLGEKYMNVPTLTYTFTVKAPAPTTVPFTISWSGDGFTAVKYTIQGESEADATSGQQIDVPAGKTVTVAVKLADWYKLDQELANPYDPATTSQLTLSAAKVTPDPQKPITPTEVGIISGAFAKDVDVSKVVVWAEANGVTVADVNAMEFGETLTVKEKAYLFNSATDSDSVLAEEKAFAFTSITAGVTPVVGEDVPNTNIAEEPYNGTVEVKSFKDAACTIEPEGGETALFYRAFLKK